MQRVVKLLVALATLVLLVGVAFVGWNWWQDQRQKDKTIEEQKRIIAALGEKLDRSWASEIVGDVRVESMDTNDKGDPTMRVTFAQYAPGTQTPILKKTMTLLGDELYIDAFVVTFDRKFVEEGDGLRGKSLLLFRRAFGDRQRPIDGVPLFRRDDAVDVSVPEQLQIDPNPSAFEKDLWKRFWILANDPKEAEKEGVRVAQGVAPHVKAVAGQVYKLTLKNSGELEITPRLPAAMIGDAAPPP
jgi:hypothetical protein